MKYQSLSDTDEHQQLNGSSAEIDRTSETHQSQKSGSELSIYEQLLMNKTAWCIVITIIIVFFAVVEIEKKNNEILSVRQAQGTPSRLQEFEVPKSMKQISQSKEKGQEEGSKIQQKQKQKEETKKVSTNEKILAGTNSGQKINAGTLVRLRNQDIYSTSVLADEERSYYEQKYKISKYDQLPFCIVVPSYNNINRNRYLFNIKSILMQEYTNYHIVFIDDASTDGTGQQIRKFMIENQTKITSQRFVVVKNKEQKTAIPNLRMAAKEFCEPEEIFLRVDGDDELLGRQVLKLLNSAFQLSQAWFIYTNFLVQNGGEGYSRPYPESTIQGNDYRYQPFLTGHLRAFYTQLFLNIKEEDLKDDDGKYLQAAYDVATFLPILEMSHEKVGYVPEFTYLNKAETGQNNKVLRLSEQMQNAEMLRLRPKYQPLKEVLKDFASKQKMIKPKSMKQIYPPKEKSHDEEKNIKPQVTNQQHKAAVKEKIKPQVTNQKEKQKKPTKKVQMKEKIKPPATNQKQKSKKQTKKVEIKEKIKPPALNQKQKQKKETKQVPKKDNIVAGISYAQIKKVGRWIPMNKSQNIYSSSPLVDEERSYYQQKYKVSKYEELPFCIVVPSYNNTEKNRHINNINSILKQEYKNYHIVFIDDASTDGTGEQIEKFLAVSQTKIPPERFTVVKNKEQKRAMFNLRMAAKQYCKPEEIFLIVDGDDELIGRQVFKLLNSVFQKQKAWFVYTNSFIINKGLGYSRPYSKQTIKDNNYRKGIFYASHLRAFYTQLFLNIKEEDLKDKDGNYLKAANDVAICMPILQMSHEKVKYVPELTYIYNADTGQNNHKMRLNEQKANDKMVRSKPKYKPLTELFPDKSSKTSQKQQNGKTGVHSS